VVTTWINKDYIVRHACTLKDRLARIINFVHRDFRITVK